MSIKRKQQKNLKIRFEHDILVLLLGIALAVVLVKTPVAFVALSELAHVSSLLTVAFFGALGAVLGDLLIFKFLRDRLDRDVVFLLKGSSRLRRLKALFHLKLFRWVSFFIGGLILATPLPDELGLAVMGLSKTRIWVFALISFAFKFVSILFIVWLVKTF